MRFCKKNIKDKAVTAGLGYKRFELCYTCGAPVLDFLKRTIYRMIQWIS